MKNWKLAIASAAAVGALVLVPTVSASAGGSHRIYHPTTTTVPVINPTTTTTVAPTTTTVAPTTTTSTPAPTLLGTGEWACGSLEVSPLSLGAERDAVVGIAIRRGGHIVIIPCRFLGFPHVRPIPPFPTTTVPVVNPTTTTVAPTTTTVPMVNPTTTTVPAVNPLGGRHHHHG